MQRGSSLDRGSGGGGPESPGWRGPAFRVPLMLPEYDQAHCQGAQPAGERAVAEDGDVVKDATLGRGEQNWNAFLPM